MKRLQVRPVQAVFYSFAVIILTLTSIVSLTAQTFRGGITGTVTDPTGSAVAGAAVSALETSTNASYQTVSSSAGEFEFSNLPLGSYTITIVSTGFSTAKYDKVQVAAGASYVLPAKLAVSSSSQTIEVTAAALTLDTSSDVQATVLPERVVQNLPNSGRDFTQMVAQTTGFAGLSTGGGGGDSSVNGTRSNSVNWQIEGTDNNDFWWNIPAVNQGGVSAIAGVVFPIDAIDSFNFVTTGSTSLGRNPGGTANLIVKSGTNQLHGSAYYFNHNEFFQRQNPFSDTKPASRLQDYGFSVGAPIIKEQVLLLPRRRTPELPHRRAQSRYRALSRLPSPGIQRARFLRCSSQHRSVKSAEWKRHPCRSMASRCSHRTG